MRKLFLVLVLILPALSGHAAQLTPILVANGEAFMTCDGQMRFMNTTPLRNKEVVATYLFANLITDPSAGLDIILWSPSYGDHYPPPYAGGPSSKWGSLGDLHIFAQPAGHTGGRQGDRYMSFQPDGILVNDYVQIAAICWGGGTAEIYAQIWVRPASE